MPFVGRAHSGIDDARNIARCALVLMQEHRFSIYLLYWYNSTNADALR